MSLQVITLTDDQATYTCKLSKGEECCGFLILGKDGFECAKSSEELGKLLLKRLVDGTSNAKGFGEWEGCIWKKRNKKIKV